jgi:hypothetical protein
VGTVGLLEPAPELCEIIAIAGDGPRPEIGMAETRGERLQPVIPLGKDMVASLAHNHPLAYALHFLRQMAAIGRDYNAQGGLDTKIGGIIWTRRTRQERLISPTTPQAWSITVLA